MVKNRIGTLNVKHKFTGQELDSESGLYYYGARYYDPEIGRFISPDSIVPDFSNPQSLNRYSYALNNPVIIRDADGHDPILAAALVIVSVSAAIGAINAGIQTEWNTAAMLKGAAIGAVSAAVGFGAGLAISTVVQSTVIIGMVGGAAAGATSSALSGGNVLQGMAIGAIGGAVGGGIAGLKGVDPFGKLVLGVAAGGVVSGIASELSGGTFSQGVMLTAMNAVTIFAIEQSNTDSNGVKTGVESEKKANTNIKTDMVLLAAAQTEETVTDAGGGILLPIVNPNRPGDNFNPNNIKDNTKAINEFNKKLKSVENAAKVEKLAFKTIFKSILFKIIHVQSWLGMLLFPDSLNEGEDQWVKENCSR